MPMPARKTARKSANAIGFRIAWNYNVCKRQTGCRRLLSILVVTVVTDGELVGEGEGK